MLQIIEEKTSAQGGGGIRGTSEKYSELIEAIIKKQIMIIGATMVLEAVQKLKELQVKNDGSVGAISGDPKKLLVDLVDLFRDLYGNFGEISCKKAAKEIIEKYPDLEVPNKLR
ncbi:MAG: hypothetical protein AAB851_02190 [Patescibacteria group bacterium]